MAFVYHQNIGLKGLGASYSKDLFPSYGFKLSTLYSYSEKEGEYRRKGREGGTKRGEEKGRKEGEKERREGVRERKRQEKNCLRQQS